MLGLFFLFISGRLYSIEKLVLYDFDFEVFVNYYDVFYRTGLCLGILIFMISDLVIIFFGEDSSSHEAGLEYSKNNNHSDTDHSNNPQFYYLFCCVLITAIIS